MYNQTLSYDYFYFLTLYILPLIFSLTYLIPNTKFKNKKLLIGLSFVPGFNFIITGYFFFLDLFKYK